MHRTCKNTSVKPDRKWWMTMKKNSFYVLARCNCCIWRSRVIQIAKTVQALKKVKPRKWTACSTVQTEFCRYTSGRLPMHHQRMWASSLAVIPQTLSLPSAELEVLHLSRWFTQEEGKSKHQHMKPSPKRATRKGKRKKEKGDRRKTEQDQRTRAKTEAPEPTWHGANLQQPQHATGQTYLESGERMMHPQRMQSLWGPRHSSYNPLDGLNQVHNFNLTEKPDKKVTKEMAASSLLSFAEKKLLSWLPTVQRHWKRKSDTLNTSTSTGENQKGQQFTLLRRITNSKVFFRPTPLSFRQVVQHVQLHVA